MAVQRRGGFVKNHQMKGRLGDREGAGHFDHLPFANRQIADHGIGSNTVTRKNFVEFTADQFGGPLSPTPSGDARVKDTRIFGHREIRAKRQFLENASNSQFLGEKRRITLPRAAADNDLPVVRSKRARQHMHQRRFAGAVMADQPDALSGVDRKINPCKGTDGAEMLFDAGQPDDIHERFGHEMRKLNRALRAIAFNAMSIAP